MVTGAFRPRQLSPWSWSSARVSAVLPFGCCEWLHVYTGLDRRTARERVRVARKLANFPALRVRDGGCRFPGCGLRFIDGHHIHHWADGGETNMDNLVSLCRFHHRAVHEDGFRVQRRGDGTFKFFSPEGWPLGRGRPCIDVDINDPQVALVRQNRRRGIDPKWMGTAAS